MHDNATAATAPHFQMIQMSFAYRTSRILHVAAELNIADHIAGGIVSVHDLAQVTATHAPSLLRLLRCLCSLGVLARDSEHHFRLTALGATLRSDVSGSMRALVRAVGREVSWDAWRHLRESITTGKSGVDLAVGEPYFDYLAHHPNEGAIFNDFMASLYGSEASLVAGAYDFSHGKTVVDLGGGTGGLLGTILETHSHLDGILYDLPHTTEAAQRSIEARGLSSRCKVMGGNFFETVPSGGDFYILSHILHDWDEFRIRSLLRTCRAAMSKNARLVVVECVLSESDDTGPGRMIDMVMLAITGGKERTKDEYAELFAAEGLRLIRLIPTIGPSSLLEVVPV
jgi:hypothetical protein